MDTFVPIGQGPAVPASPEDLAKDEQGITNPNLHRRINEGVIYPGEYAPRQYTLAIHGVYSYRTTEIFLDSERDIRSEVP